MPATSPDAAGATEVVVGIDLGGTGTRFVATTPTGSQTLARVTIPTPESGTAAEIASFLREQIHVVSRGTRPVAIGVGASGPVDLAGIIRNPDTLPAFTGLPILELLRRITDGPTVIDNDAVCAAVAEHHVGVARHAPRSLHVTLGTGVGVCLLNDGQPFRNVDGTHPEGGHIAVTTPTPRCYCGRSACWEQVASRQSLQRTAARILDRPATSRAAIAALADRAARGDADALAAFDNYGQGIGEGLGTLLTLYGPPLVVIGGSAADYLHLYSQSLKMSLDNLAGWIPAHQLRKTALNDYGGAIGAARLATVALSKSQTIETMPLNLDEKLEDWGNPNSSQRPQHATRRPGGRPSTA